MCREWAKNKWKFVPPFWISGVGCYLERLPFVSSLLWKHQDYCWYHWYNTSNSNIFRWQPTVEFQRTGFLAIRKIRAEEINISLDFLRRLEGIYLGAVFGSTLYPGLGWEFHTRQRLWVFSNDNEETNSRNEESRFQLVQRVLLPLASLCHRESQQTKSEIGAGESTNLTSRGILEVFSTK